MLWKKITSKYLGKIQHTTTKVVNLHTWIPEGPFVQ